MLCYKKILVRKSLTLRFQCQHLILKPYFLVAATVAQVVDDRVDNFLNKTSRLHVASHCLPLVEILT